MKIVVFGTGYVGSAIVHELADREHEVIAVSRSGKTDVPAQVVSVTGSVHEPAFLDSVTSEADAIVSALPALSSEGDLDVAVTALLPTAQAAGARLGVVGGAAIIPTVTGGPCQADTLSSRPSSPRWSMLTSGRWTPSTLRRSESTGSTLSQPESSAPTIPAPAPGPTERAAPPRSGTTRVARSSD